MKLQHLSRITLIKLIVTAVENITTVKTVFVENQLNSNQCD